MFLQTGLMHSESRQDHARLERIQDHADANTPQILRDWFDLMRRGGAAHTDVVQRFGRYPHRNAANGCTNTASEQAWLDDGDNLPSWASRN